MNKYLLVLLFFVSSNAFPALIKWVDTDGRVHYSDVPPPPSASAKILSSTTTKKADPQSADNASEADASSEPKSIVEREAELKKARQEKQEAADKAAKEQASKEAKKTYCNALQQNIKTLQQGVRMVEVDASGAQSFLEEDQRKQRIAKLQQDYTTNCQ